MLGVVSLARSLFKNFVIVGYSSPRDEFHTFSFCEEFGCGAVLPKPQSEVASVICHVREESSVCRGY